MQNIYLNKTESLDAFPCHHIHKLVAFKNSLVLVQPLGLRYSWRKLKVAEQFKWPMLHCQWQVTSTS